MRASSHAVGLIGALLVGLVMRSPLPPCEDADVAAVAERFSAALSDDDAALSIVNRGELKRDRDTFFFKLFADAFGANPSTPYMWTALPLLRWLLPCPLWHVRRHDAVVLLRACRRRSSTSRSRPSPSGRRRAARSSAASATRSTT